MDKTFKADESCVIEKNILPLCPNVRIQCPTMADKSLGEALSAALKRITA